MRHLMLIAAIASLAMPAFADPRGRGHGGYGRRGAFVAPRPVYPAYPVYPAAPVYQPGYGAYRDPYYGDYAISAPFGPPAPIMERYGPCPGPGYVWVNGFWRWGGGRYVWAPGFWTRPPRVHSTWVAGGWFGGPGGFRFRAGFWR